MNLRIYRKLKKDKLLNACLNILNEETAEDNDFCFECTEDFEEFNANTLKVEDTHTKIYMEGTHMQIIITPPNMEPYTFEYRIMGVRFTKTI